MNISDNGVELIKKFEGYKENAYLDSAGIPTIGYGTIVYPNGQKVKMGDKTTIELATSYLKDHLNRNVVPYLSAVKVYINQNQIDALCSFIYNVGATNFKNSTLLKKINSSSSIDEIEVEFLKWVKVKGITVAGLVNRRKAEVVVFKS